MDSPPVSDLLHPSPSAGSPSQPACSHCCPSPERNHLQEAPELPNIGILPSPPHINQVIFPEQRGSGAQEYKSNLPDGGSLALPLTSSMASHLTCGQCPHLQNGETNSTSLLGLYSQQTLTTEPACTKHPCCALSRRAPSCFQTSNNSHPKLLVLASSHSTPPCSYHSVSVLEHTTPAFPIGPCHALSPKALPLCSRGHAFWRPRSQSLTTSVLLGPSERPFHLLLSCLCVRPSPG